jgi:predicted protein tyrosine phosphatase
LIHCHAGVSRSTAATLLILAQVHARAGEGVSNPAAGLAELADGRLRRQAPRLQRRLAAALGPLYAWRLKAA